MRLKVCWEKNSFFPVLFPVVKERAMKCFNDSFVFTFNGRVKKNFKNCNFPLAKRL
jgi:hypothetical protein